MTQLDVLWEIFSWFDIKKRLEIASCDQHLSKAALKWCDIHELIINNDNITIVSINLIQILKYCDKKDLKQQLKILYQFCHSIRYLRIQYELIDADIQLLKPYLENIYVLQLSSFSFHRNMSLNLNGIRFTNLQTIKILQPTYQCISTAPELKICHVMKLMPRSITQIVLTGIVVYPAVVEYIFRLPHLRVLDMKGALTDTKASIKSLNIINASESLVELSLPPSLFCFTDRKWFPDVPSIDLRKSKLKKLSVFVHKYDKTFFWSQVNLLIPPTLERLILFGNHIKLSICPQFETWAKREIVQFEKSTFGIEDPCWERTTVKLIRHMIYPVQRENWQFALGERLADESPNRAPLNRLIFNRRREGPFRNRAGRNEDEQGNVEMDIDNDGL